MGSRVCWEVGSGSGKHSAPRAGKALLLQVQNSRLGASTREQRPGLPSTLLILRTNFPLCNQGLYNSTRTLNGRQTCKGPICAPSPSTGSSVLLLSGLPYPHWPSSVFSGISSLTLPHTVSLFLHTLKVQLGQDQCPCQPFRMPCAFCSWYSS